MAGVGETIALAWVGGSGQNGWVSRPKGVFFVTFLGGPTFSAFYIIYSPYSIFSYTLKCFPNYPPAGENKFQVANMNSGSEKSHAEFLTLFPTFSHTWGQTWENHTPSARKRGSDFSSQTWQGRRQNPTRVSWRKRPNWGSQHSKRRFFVTFLGGPTCSAFYGVYFWHIQLHIS